jgi:hypothetical protein
MLRVPESRVDSGSGRLPERTRPEIFVFPGRLREPEFIFSISGQVWRACIFSFYT